jgi:hypothetical protein
MQETHRCGQRAPNPQSAIRNSALIALIYSDLAHISQEYGAQKTSAAQSLAEPGKKGPSHE